MEVAFIILCLFVIFGVLAGLAALWSHLRGTPFVESIERRFTNVKLARIPQNPILIPVHNNAWEAEAVFNPAAVYENGRVHLLYRAMGHDGISRVGYASSADGVHFDERFEAPAFVPPDRRAVPDKKKHGAAYAPKIYPSGGGWGGIEDPRMVKIEDRMYMTFVAFDGWGFIRMAFTSIHEQDFETKNWKKFTTPRLLSPPDQVHKNWVLFPEKINGKFAVMHSISPTVQIEYVDSMDEFDGSRFIESKFTRVKRDTWDTFLRGVGPPPVRTERGWLVLYHAIDGRETDRYKLGAMLLDINDPTVVLARSEGPILEPDAWYENHGKDGVVYATGALVLNKTLYVYYGGGDTSINVATIGVDSLLDSLVAHTKPVFARSPVQL